MSIIAEYTKDESGAYVLTSMKPTIRFWPSADDNEFVVHYDRYTLAGGSFVRQAGWMLNNGSDEWEFVSRSKVYPRVGEPLTKDILAAFDNYCDANGITYA